jgi:TatD DNase family protein
MSDVPLVDFHCHLDLFRDPVQAFLDCKSTNVLTLAVTTTPRAWKQNMLWAEGNRFTVPGLGLHPELVASHSSEAKLLLELINGAHVIGEVGLDGSSRHKASLTEQKQIFDNVLTALSKRRRAVVSIHSRGAVREVLENLAAVSVRNTIVPVLHWFAGTPAQLRSAIELGCWFSVNKSMLETDRGRSLIKGMPTDRILTESDAPFRGGKTISERNKDLHQTVLGIAKLIGVPPTTLSSNIFASASKLITQSH